MTAPETPPGFARLIAAVKGVASMVDWATRPEAEVKALPPAHSHCAAAPPAGWRCVLRAPHERCVLEEVR